MSHDDQTADIRHNPGAHRFETTIDGVLARLDYRIVGRTIQLTHTEVPKALGGRGIAAALVKEALAHAQANNLKVAPYCSYVRGYMKKHPETQGMLAEGMEL